MADYDLKQILTSPSGAPIESDVALSGGLTSVVAVPDEVKTRLTLEPTSSTVKLEPVQTTSTVTTTSSLDMKSESRVSTDSRVKLDVEPVVSDVCTRIRFDPLPPTRVHQPWHNRVGFSVLGVEMAAIELTGHLDTVVRPERAPPRVLPRDAHRHHHADHHHHHGDHHHHDDDHHHHRGHGLRVRLD